MMVRVMVALWELHNSTKIISLIIREKINLYNCIILMFNLLAIYSVNKQYNLTAIEISTR